MMCEDLYSVKHVRESFGLYNPNEKPLKYGARVGLNFSSTKFVARLE